MNVCYWLRAKMIALVFESHSVVAHAAVFVAVKASQSMNDSMLNRIMKSWTVTRVIMRLLCEHGVEARKNWAFIAHFFNSSNTTMPVPCADIYCKAPMSHFWNWRVDMGCQVLNLQLGQLFSQISRLHACLQNVQHIESPNPLKSLPCSGSVVSLDQTDPARFWNLQN